MKNRKSAPFAAPVSRHFGVQAPLFCALLFKRMFKKTRKWNKKRISLNRCQKKGKTLLSGKVSFNKNDIDSSSLFTAHFVKLWKIRLDFWEVL
ncbi:hypothetical protein INF35_06315 [Subdoligranulum sp. DSM 109015]|uniref:Uncharacterized protein n=1 Tax=Gemmiger gallinarum TaxID=2779354 RepID=A0ABR9R2K6_9FIRM|nr:hypothetical protein [Gemmiger gallinarum]MBE5037391.1 hypothetical protein [Gemmiger gallinarum]